MPDHQCHRILVTGANVGLGYDTCKKLAILGVEKIILSCRSEEKANAAIIKLVEETGKPASTFEFVIIDTGDLNACRKAVESLEGGIDGLILNAGGLLFKNGHEMNACGATNITTTNLLGHAVLTEGLIAAGKLEAGAHVVCIGSEVARGVPLMGMKAATYKQPNDKVEMVSYLNGSAFKKYNAELAYAYAKSQAALYISALARKYPEYVIVTTSPGATSGTEAAADAPFLLKLMIRYLGTTLMPLLGMMHGIDKGTQRYLSAVGYREKGEEEIKTGNFYASKKGKSAGPYVAQGSVYPLYDDESAQDAAYAAVHSFLKVG